MWSRNSQNQHKHKTNTIIHFKFVLICDFQRVLKCHICKMNDGNRCTIFISYICMVVGLAQPLNAHCVHIMLVHAFNFLIFLSTLIFIFIPLFLFFCFYSFFVVHSDSNSQPNIAKTRVAHWACSMHLQKEKETVGDVDKFCKSLLDVHW
jgi:hypothetical protein